jgi:hypothetical protein
VSPDGDGGKDGRRWSEEMMMTLSSRLIASRNITEARPEINSMPVSFGSIQV